MPPVEAASSLGWAWTVISVSGFPAVPTVGRGRRMEHGSRAGRGVVLGVIREVSLTEGPQVYAALPACLPHLNPGALEFAPLCSARLGSRSTRGGAGPPTPAQRDLAR